MLDRAISGKGPQSYLSIFIAVVLVAFAIYYWTRESSPIPIINKYPNDPFLQKAHTGYLQNSQSLIACGVSKYNAPFRIITTLGSRVILPASFTDWVKNCKDLDHIKLVEHEYFAKYPGFEGNGVVVHPNGLMIEVTKTKLSQSSQCETLAHQISSMLAEEWGDGGRVEWSKNVARYVGRMSSTVFVGPELASEPEWQKLILTYTVNLFGGVRALRTWPSFTRPLVHWFLPQCRKCREQVNLARTLLRPTLEKREMAKREAEAKGVSPPKYEDTIFWMQELANRRKESNDPAATQLAFAISSMHTTSQLMDQVLVDICTHFELIQPLRDELEAALQETNGVWTTATTFKMPLMDSVIKETQRLKPGSLVNLERKVTRTVTLPEGAGVLPKGTNIAVDTSAMWDPEIYSDPLTYNGHRFLEPDQSGRLYLVSPSPKHIAFGLGRHMCPGRFMVANEIKIAIGIILLKYDVKILSEKPKVSHYGFEMLSDPGTIIQVEKR